VRVVIDTNVLVSGVFFGGIPGTVLGLWRNNVIELVLTSEILTEYEDVVQRLSSRYPKVDVAPIVSLIVRRGTFVQAVSVADSGCPDPDDDRFLAAAVAGDVGVLISGDRHLLAVSRYQEVEVLSPADFIRRFGSEPAVSADR